MKQTNGQGRPGAEPFRPSPRAGGAVGVSGGATVSATGTNHATDDISIDGPSGAPAVVTLGGTTTSTGGAGSGTFPLTPSTGSTMNVSGGGGAGTDTLIFPTVVPTSSTGTAPNKTYSLFSGAYRNVVTTNVANEP